MTLPREPGQDHAPAIDFRQLVENARDIIYMHDLEGRFTWVNRAVEAVTGYTRAEILSMDLWALLAPASVPTVRDAITHHLTADLENFEVEIRAKDGRVLPLELSTRLVFQNGVPAWVQGIARDVTERHQAASALRASEDKFRCVVEQAIVGNYIIQEGCFVYVNPKFAEIFGYEAHEVVGKRIEELVHPEDRALVLENVRRRLANEMPSILYGFRALRKDGQEIEVEVHGRRTELSGKPAAIGTLLDVTERRRVEQQMSETQERYALAALGANDGLWDWNLKSNELFLSTRWKAMLGFGPGELGSDPEVWFGRVHPDDRQRFFGDLGLHLDGRTPHFETEVRLGHADGSWRWMLVRGMAVRDANDTPSRMAGSQTDVTERRVAADKLLHDALHDGLTGLPNRTLLMDRIGQAIALLQRRRAASHFAVLYLDIDRFKTINESLGHIHGDRLLVAVAGRLQSCVGPGDTVARLGGDEFCVFLQDYQDDDEPQRAADRIHAALEAPHDLAGTEVLATTSIGIARADPAYTRPEEMLRDADTAMYRAKHLGRAQHVEFEKSMHAQARAQLQLESDLRRALERHELQLTYQPIISLSTGAIVGGEALVVWDHPARGRLRPGEFIPLAEETGLILPLGHWVLREACRKAQEWNEKRPRGSPLSVSVNISGKQLVHAQLTDQIRGALAESGLEPRRLRLEITESVIMENVGPAAMVIAQLKALQVHLVLDDFGTGYSSLAYLHNFRFDTLKIDRSFVHRMEQSAKNAEIVRTVVSLARALGMDVVAEGVETQSQVEQLQLLRCDYAQGYHFARPLDPTAFRALLDEVRPWPLAASAVPIAGRGRGGPGRL